MMTKQHTVTPDTPDRAISCLNALKTASESLKQALLNRDPNAIFAAVDEQEEIVRRFRDSERLEGKEISRATADEKRREITGIVENIRQEQRTSRALAMSFLKAIEKTFQSLGVEMEKTSVTYNSSGSMGSRASSLLVHQTG